VSGRVADALVLAFSEGVSLRVWEGTGLIEREWALYRRLSGRYGVILLVTYGDAGDAAILPRLQKLMPPGPGVARVELVCNEGGLRPAEYLDALPRLVAAALGQAKTVVVKTNQMSGGEAAAAIAAELRGLGKDVGLVARGGYLWSRFAAWESGADSPAAARAGDREGRLCRSADVVVGTTRQMVDDLAWRHGLGAAKLSVVPNYVVEGDGAAAVERHADEILFAGRLVAQKRVDLLIEAVAVLNTQLAAPARLTIVGDGPLEADLRRRAGELRVPAEFVPRLGHAELLERMRRCAVYAQTSLYEGHPKTVIEAMAAGTPVLVTDAPGLREVVENGVTGVVVSPDPAVIAAGLRAMLEDAKSRKAMGAAAAQESAARYGLGPVAELDAAACARALELGRGKTDKTGGIDLATAVKFEPGLLKLETAAAVDAWERSLSGFTRRLAPPARAKFLAALDGPIYHMQGRAALEAEGGMHPKHRVMRYHDFFVDRIRRGERVIDLGCGVGALAASIADRSGAKVTGMDWMAANLDKARALAAERGLSDRLNYVQGDITSERAPGKFDVVVLSNVLEHITDRVERLRIWREWYTPSRMLIRVPAFDREWRVPWKRELGVEWRLDVTHETEYTQAELETELRRAGLVPAEWVVRWGEYWVASKPG